MFGKFRANIADLIPILRELRQIRKVVRHIDDSVDAIHKMEAIRGHELTVQSHPRYSDLLRLHRFGFQVNSQNYEDGMIHEIFKRVGTSSRVFAEVGVGDGTENNTAFLLSQGWTGFWIDGCDRFMKNIQSRKDLQDSCLKTSVSFVGRENIGRIFEQIGVPRDIDLLSLDIDQNTYYLWEALHEYAPRVVVVEYNGNIPPDVEWKVEYDVDRRWDYTHNFGASLKAFEVLGKKLGYSLVGCDFVGSNAFFVRDDLAPGKFAEPFTAANHYEPPRYHSVPRMGHPRSILDRGF